MTQQLIDLSGQRFGRLIVQSEAGRDKQGRATWKCRCDCGAEKVIASRHLRSGAVVSCGCYARSIASQSGRKGAAKLRGPLSPLYKEVIGYDSLHARIRATRGPARNHLCVDCGKQARHWSYDLSDPTPAITNGLVFSKDIDRYEPRCVKCHSAHDRKARWYLQREIERRKKDLNP